MKQLGKIDVHGLSVRGTESGGARDHFAIAALSKAVRLKQSSLSIDDDSELHGDNQGHLLLVTDVMGETPASEQASSSVIDAVVAYFVNEMPWVHIADAAPSEVLELLSDTVHYARKRLRSSARGVTPTALTLAFVDWPDLYVVHVGDSRCYLSRHGALRQLTSDGPKASPGGRPKPDVGHFELLVGDVLLLATDGLVDQGKDELGRILGSSLGAATMCGHLLSGSAREDRTAVLARFLPQEGAPVGVSDAPPPGSLRARTPLERESSRESSRDRERPARRGAPGQQRRRLAYGRRQLPRETRAARRRREGSPEPCRTCPDDSRAPDPQPSPAGRAA